MEATTKMKFKKGDEVIVIAGKDKGRRGPVLRVETDGGIVVENVNVAHKHQRPNPNAAPLAKAGAGAPSRTAQDSS